MIINFKNADKIITRCQSKKGYKIKRHSLQFISVTTLLNETKSEKDKSYLKSWLKRKGSKDIVKQAIVRGLYVHRISELKALNKPISKSIAYKLHRPYLVKLLPWIENNISQVIAQEMPCFLMGRIGVAGTFDLLANVKGFGDIPVLVDFKTSRKSRLFKPALLYDYCCQLGAYSLLIKNTFGIRVKRAMLVIALPNELEIKSIGIGELQACENSFIERLNQYAKGIGK